jgi:hypothetical protein
MRRTVGVIVCLVALSGAAIASARTEGSVRTYSTPSTRPLRTALMDPNLFGNISPARAFSVAHRAGASYARVTVSWMRVAPTAPDDPSNPDSSGYHWGPLDTMVEDAQAAGVTPILDIGEAPSWALAIKAKGVGAGTPGIEPLKQFAHAVAVHFDGAHGPPAERLFQVWNEPNLSLDLSPASPSAYRAMVNAVAASAHGVNPANVVVAGGLDPFGHPKSHKQKWYSVAPLAFMRSLFCLSKGAHPHSTCKSQIHFDVWAHHPYTFGGPFGHAARPDDVSLGDLPKMWSLVQAAMRLHRVVAAHPAQFWVTEFAWDTNPPRHNALKIPLQARATAEALHQMWRSHVSVVTWYLLQDMPGRSPYKSGLYFAGRPIGSARPKPTLTAFRFPFVAYLRHGRVSIWGRDVTSRKTTVTIEQRHGLRGHWRKVARVVPNRYGIFQANLKLSATGKDWLRATAAGSGNSLAFSLTQPKYPHIGPWGS